MVCSKVFSKSTSIALTLAALILAFQRVWGQSMPAYDDLPFNYIEVEVYEPNPLENTAVLPVSYAGTHITDASAWDSAASRRRIPVSIDVVYTKYPATLTRHSRSFKQLMRKRIQSLFQLDSALTNPAITWNLVAQKDCPDEQTARNRFHGFVIKYKIESEKINLAQAGSKANLLAMIQEYNLSVVKSVILGQHTLPDSVVYKVLTRKPNWKNLLVVMDWTGSMYDYGAQAIAWHQRNFDKKIIKYLVLFNDGDDFLKTQRPRIKPIGNTGGVYFCNPNKIHEVVNTMQTVMNNGDGGDIPENNLEALLQATTRYHDYERLVMISDNVADIRDLALLDSLKVPVHIIVCGTKDRPIHPAHLTIAWRTGGSVITMERELDFNTLDLAKRKSFAIGNTLYRYSKSKNAFVIVN